MDSKNFAGLKKTTDGFMFKTSAVRNTSPKQTRKRTCYKQYDISISKPDALTGTSSITVDSVKNTLPTFTHSANGTGNCSISAEQNLRNKQSFAGLNTPTELHTVGQHTSEVQKPASAGQKHMDVGQLTSIGQPGSVGQYTYAGHHTSADPPVIQHSSTRPAGVGQHTSAGQHAAVEQHTFTGQPGSVGQYTSAGQHMSVGQYTSAGQHTSVHQTSSVRQHVLAGQDEIQHTSVTQYATDGQHRLAGQLSSLGQYTAPRQHTSVKQHSSTGQYSSAGHMSLGQHTPAVQLTSAGEQPPVGQHTSVGQHISSRQQATSGQHVSTVQPTVAGQYMTTGHQTSVQQHTSVGQQPSVRQYATGGQQTFGQQTSNRQVSIEQHASSVQPTVAGQYMTTGHQASVQQHTSVGQHTVVGQSAPAGQNMSVGCVSSVHLTCSEEVDHATAPAPSPQSFPVSPRSVVSNSFMNTTPITTVESSRYPSGEIQEDMFSNAAHVNSFNQHTGHSLTGDMSTMRQYWARQPSETVSAPKGCVADVDLPYMEIDQNQNQERQIVTTVQQTRSRNQTGQMGKRPAIVYDAETLEPFCDCDIQAYSPELKRALLFRIGGTQSIMMHASSVIINWQELVTFQKEGKVFVSVAELKSKNLIIDSKRFSTLSRMTHSVLSLEDHELDFLLQKKCLVNKKNKRCVSLDHLRWIYKTQAMDQDDLLAKSLAESPWYELKLGHWCPKVAYLRQTQQYLCPECNKVEHRPIQENLQDLLCAECATKILDVTETPDTMSSSRAGHIEIEGEYVCAFKYDDKTYVNCHHLSTFLNGFPWKNFIALAASLNVSFVEAPLSVISYFYSRSYELARLTGKVWCTLADLRCISCFSVGQMNNTPFLVKNQLLARIAQEQFKEIFPTGVPQKKLIVETHTSHPPALPEPNWSGSSMQVGEGSVVCRSTSRTQNKVTLHSSSTFSATDSGLQPQNQHRKVIVVENKTQMPPGSYYVQQRETCKDIMRADGVVFRLMDQTPSPEVTSTNVDLLSIAAKEIIESASVSPTDFKQTEEREEVLESTSVNLVNTDDSVRNEKTVEESQSTVEECKDMESDTDILSMPNSFFEDSPKKTMNLLSMTDLEGTSLTENTIVIQNESGELYECTPVCLVDELEKSGYITKSPTMTPPKQQKPDPVVLSETDSQKFGAGSEYSPDSGIANERSELLSPTSTPAEPPEGKTLSTVTQEDVVSSSEPKDLGVPGIDSEVPDEKTTAVSPCGKRDDSLVNTDTLCFDVSSSELSEDLPPSVESVVDSLDTPFSSPTFQAKGAKEKSDGKSDTESINLSILARVAEVASPFEVSESQGDLDRFLEQKSEACDITQKTKSDCASVNKIEHSVKAGTVWKEMDLNLSEKSSDEAEPPQEMEDHDQKRDKAVHGIELVQEQIASPTNDENVSSVVEDEDSNLPHEESPVSEPQKVDQVDVVVKDHEEENNQMTPGTESVEEQSVFKNDSEDATSVVEDKLGAFHGETDKESEADAKILLKGTNFQAVDEVTESVENIFCSHDPKFEKRLDTESENFHQLSLKLHDIINEQIKKRSASNSEELESEKDELNNNISQEQQSEGEIVPYRPEQLGNNKHTRKHKKSKKVKKKKKDKKDLLVFTGEEKDSLPITEDKQVNDSQENCRIACGDEDWMDANNGLMDASSSAPECGKIQRRKRKRDHSSAKTKKKPKTEENVSQKKILTTVIRTMDKSVDATTDNKLSDDDVSEDYMATALNIAAEARSGIKTEKRQRRNSSRRDKKKRKHEENSLPVKEKSSEDKKRRKSLKYSSSDNVCLPSIRDVKEKNDSVIEGMDDVLGDSSAIENTVVCACPSEKWWKDLSAEQTVKAILNRVDVLNLEGCPEGVRFQLKVDPCIYQVYGESESQKQWLDNQLHQLIQIVYLRMKQKEMKMLLGASFSSASKQCSMTDASRETNTNRSVQSPSPESDPSAATGDDPPGGISLPISSSKASKSPPALPVSSGKGNNCLPAAKACDSFQCEKSAPTGDDPPPGDTSLLMSLLKGSNSLPALPVSSGKSNYCLPAAKACDSFQREKSSDITIEVMVECETESARSRDSPMSVDSLDTPKF